MGLETYTGNIADMVATNPTPTDPKSQGDDHLRGIKYTLQQSFPNFDGPLNAARVPFTPVGSIAANNVQAAIQELDTEKLALAGGTMTGDLAIEKTDALLSVGLSTNPHVQLGPSSFLGVPYIAGSGSSLHIAGGSIHVPSIPGTSNAANAHFAMSENGRMYYSTSSIKYKYDVQTLAPVSFFDQIRPVTFKSTHEADVGKEYIGFVVEELEVLDSRLADSKGEYYDHRAIVALLVAEVQELKRRVAQLATK